MVRGELQRVCLLNHLWALQSSMGVKLLPHLGGLWCAGGQSVCTPAGRSAGSVLARQTSRKDGGTS